MRTFLLIVCVALPAAAQQRFVVEACSAETGMCSQSECACSSWKIKLFSSRGSQWGEITGKTLESVQSQLKHEQDFDKRFEKWAGLDANSDPMNSLHPSGPICVQECTVSAWPWVVDKAFKQLKQNANSLFNGLNAMIWSEWDRTDAALDRRATPGRAGNYEEALRDAMNRLFALRRALMRAEYLGVAESPELKEEIDEAESAVERLQTAIEARNNAKPTPAPVPAPTPTPAPVSTVVPVAPVAAPPPPPPPPQWTLPSSLDVQLPGTVQLPLGFRETSFTVQQNFSSSGGQLTLISNFHKSLQMLNNLGESRTDVHVECQVAISQLEPLKIDAGTRSTQTDSWTLQSSPVPAVIIVLKSMVICSVNDNSTVAGSQQLKGQFTTLALYMGDASSAQRLADQLKAALTPPPPQAAAPKPTPTVASAPVIPPPQPAVSPIPAPAQDLQQQKWQQRMDQINALIQSLNPNGSTTAYVNNTGARDDGLYHWYWAFYCNPFGFNPLLPGDRDKAKRACEAYNSAPCKEMKGRAVPACEN